MGHYDRSMLSSLTRLFGFVGLVLVGLFWINRAVILFDQLIADGHSALVFLELTVLGLPEMIRMVMPVAAFVAALIATNSAAAGSELVVMRAAGTAPGRLARPYVIFGLGVAGLVLVLTHLLVPLSQGRLAARQHVLMQDFSTRLLSPGRFARAGDNVTLYVREVTPQGQLRDVFIADHRDPAQSALYTAAEAQVLETEAGVQLSLLSGAAQRLNGDSNQLLVTRFDRFVLDISALISLPGQAGRSLRQIPTQELLTAAPALQRELSQSRAALLYAAHARSNQAVLALVASLLGFVPLLIGRFSRFGLGWQMAAATGLVILVSGIDGIGAAAARQAAENWPLSYLSSGVGAALVVGLFALARMGPRRSWVRGRA